MKAIVYENYGPPEVLQLKDVPKPIPKDNEVLVKVHAVAINEWDWGLLRGKPFINRMISGLSKPKKIKILGCDISGVVEAVGKNVKRFKSGDEVFGDLSEEGWGGFAEYVCAAEDVLAKKPAKMTFEEAAAIPQAGILALQGLRKIEIKKGTRILFNGGGGGVGTLGVQIAKSYGAHVTGVDKPEKFDMMRSIGFDEVIDHTKEDFSRNGQVYDLILDPIGFRPISDYKRSLSPTGTCGLIGGYIPFLILIMIFGKLIPGKKKIGIVALKPNPEDLDHFSKLFKEGIVKPVIDKRYPLSEVPEAFRYYESGRFLGKIIITVAY
jgi:NADPH:quinone reductase-like Zn-dependent oxidoreductase